MIADELLKAGLFTCKESHIGTWAEAFKLRYEKSWWETSMEFPELGAAVNQSVKKYKEKHSDMLIEAFSKKLESMPDNTHERSIWHKDVLKLAREASGELLGITDRRLSEIIFGGFMDTTNLFIKEVKAFSPNTGLPDIMQAMRNVWIMNCMQVLLGLGVKFTPSIFAYSMLYPVTDNYMDDTKISSDMKLNISRNFRKRLSGEGILPGNMHEEAIFKLIERIEAQYSRSEYPRVYDSLLCIHSAQEQSIQQQGKALSPYERDIMAISFEKGGTSVLADAFLVNGDLSFQDAGFVFGFGVLLQLIDDLQDTARDLKNGHMTVFSQTAQGWHLDSITNRLFNFVLFHLESWMSCARAEVYEMLSLMKRSCILLMMEAIAANRRFYSREYLDKIEAYSPYSFVYFQRLGARLKKRYSRLAGSAGDNPIEAIVSIAASNSASCV